jgi:hypothetical protein
LKVGRHVIVGDAVAIKKLSEKLDEDALPKDASSLHTPEPLNTDPQTPEGPPPTTPPLPASFSQDAKLVTKVMEETKRKKLEEQDKEARDQQQAEDDMRRGLRVRAKAEQAKKERPKEQTPVREKKPSIDRRDVESKLKDITEEPRAHIKHLAKWQNEIVACLGVKS